ncbi:hypothetical protein [Pyrococcus kukulkanii]|uniref:hypothetical protein n=1 Tax=Pyrococcus kukulkanii TaxID=1609559 RepID=UPI0035628F4E
MTLRIYPPRETMREVSYKGFYSDLLDKLDIAVRDFREAVKKRGGGVRGFVLAALLDLDLAQLLE